MKPVIIFIAFVLLVATVYGQPQLQDFNQQRIKITKTGMVILGSWGAANMAVGAIGLATADGEAKYFHQMNLLWGAANFAIALPAYFGQRKAKKDIPFAQSIKEQSKIEKTFLINGGLDLVYITAGVYCLEKAKNTSNKDRYRGYGKSLFVQGGGLLLFDCIMYFTHLDHGKQLYNILNKLEFSGNSVGFVWKL